MNKSFLLLLSLVISWKALAYTENRGASGLPIKWQDGTQNLEFVFYANNATEALIFSQIANEWSSTQDITITTSYSGGTPAGDENSVYYSSNPAFFGGGGVAAVTNITYDYASGKILDADILINESALYSTDPAIGSYLGDVLSHELGHALGLAHSEVKHATMFYWLTRGQHSLSPDDQAGAYAIYPDVSLGAKGKITGKIQGAGQNGSGIPIFGAHVQALSEKDGRVLGSTLSLENGKFEIAGLPLDENYFLYVSPVKVKGSLPEYYSDVRNDFCTSSTSYRGSFYQSCNSSQRGYPQAIALTGANPTQAAGVITIRCNLEVPTEYISNKDSFYLTPLAQFPGGAMVGSVESDELADKTSQFITIDLTEYDPGGETNLFLEFKLTYQSLYSVMHLQAQVNQNGTPMIINDVDTILGDDETFDTDFNPVLDLVGRVPLSTLASVNFFELEITPQSLSEWKTSISSSLSDDEYYAKKTIFADPVNYFFLNYRVVKKNGTEYEHFAGANHQSVSDNKQCLDGPYAYSITANVDQSIDIKPRRSQKDDGGFACGSVDLSAGGGNGGSGFLSFLLGLMLLALMRPKSAGRNRLV